MPLPTSISQLNKLGDRLAASDPPADADLAALAEVVRAYQALLDTVKAELDSIGFQATSRVKTNSTLIEKLRREQRMTLSRMQDLAGARIVVAGGRREQDDVVEKIREHFQRISTKPLRVMDRRENPSWGYRAVHVVVYPEGIPVEIQIRTELQNSWAQVYEAVADLWGRGIRYGELPEQPSRRVMETHGQALTRRAFVRQLLSLSDVIASAEMADTAVPFVKETMDRLRAGSNPDRLPDIGRADDVPPALLKLVEQQLGRVDDLGDLDVRTTYFRMRGMFKMAIMSAGLDRKVAGRVIRRTFPLTRNPDFQTLEGSLVRAMDTVGRLFDERYDTYRQQRSQLRSMMENMTEAIERGLIT